MKIINLRRVYIYIMFSLNCWCTISTPLELGWPPLPLHKPLLPPREPREPREECLWRKSNPRSPRRKQRPLGRYWRWLTEMMLSPRLLGSLSYLHQNRKQAGVRRQGCLWRLSLLLLLLLLPQYPLLLKPSPRPTPPRALDAGQIHTYSCCARINIYIYIMMFPFAVCNMYIYIEPPKRPTNRSNNKLKRRLKRRLKRKQEKQERKLKKQMICPEPRWTRWLFFPNGASSWRCAKQPWRPMASHSCSSKVH